MEYKELNIALNDIELEKFNILEFEVRSKYNSKSNLLLVLDIENEFFNRIQDMFYNKEVIINLKKDDKSIFQGILNEVMCENLSDKRVVVRIESEDTAYTLRKEVKNRVYQDKDITYRAIIEDIMKDSGLSYHISKVFDKKIDKLFYQNESDWNFLLRLISYLGQPLFVTNEGVVLFGFDSIYNGEKLENAI